LKDEISSGTNLLNSVDTALRSGSRYVETDGYLFSSNVVGTAVDVAADDAKVLPLDFQNHPWAFSDITDDAGLPVFVQIYATNEEKEESAMGISLATGANLIFEAVKRGS
jgi:hypothetical protein